MVDFLVVDGVLLLVFRVVAAGFFAAIFKRGKASINGWYFKRGKKILLT